MRGLFALLSLALAVSGVRAEASTYNHPMIALACFFPAWNRANAFDCAVKRVVKQDKVVVDSEMPELDKILFVSGEFYRLGREAIAACGNDCRDAVGVTGYQCMAIAQSPVFTGFGSFMGRERNLEDAKRTALNDCQRHVGTPGAACTIIVEACPPGVN